MMADTNSKGFRTFTLHYDSDSDDADTNSSVKFFVSPDDAGLPEDKHLFCELAELRDGGTENATWVETARWIKFEEDVEESGMKWSKPHVTSLSLHDLFDLKKELEKASTLFDVEVHTGLELADSIIITLENDEKLDDGIQENLGKIILKKHRHLYEDTRAHFPHLKKKGSKTSLNGMHMVSTGPEGGSGNSIRNGDQTDQYLSPPERPSFSRNISYAERLEKFDDAGMHHVKSNAKLMKHIPKGAEAANVLVGAVDFLTETLSIFVRLGQGAKLADLTEVPLPTRFVYILLGPMGSEKKYHEVGRCMSTLLSDERFKETAYTATSREALIQGLDQFMDAVIVLPPSEWDPSIRLEPPSLPPTKKRKSPDTHDEQEDSETREGQEGEGGHGDDPALKRTGRLFGGLVSDIKRKLPYYWSDYKDAIAVQSIASVFYIYMAALTPIITFGGVLQDETDRWMGTMEGLLAGAIACVTFGLFAGQPLNIIGSTGPMLVFERILFTFCQQNGLSFLAFRFWIGMWSTLYLLLVVAFDLSYLVIYITRFTEESFACLISVIFIYEAIEKVLHMEHDYAINKHPRSPDAWHCECDPKMPSNDTNMTDWTTGLMTTSSWTTPLANHTEAHDPMSISEIREHCEGIGGHLNGCHDIPDVFLFSILIFLGTFVLAYILKMFRNSPFFPSKVRELFSDFNVVIAIVLMTVTDWSTSLDTPKLQVPEKVEPSRAADRGWVVHPFDNNAWWTALAGFLPAIVATILIFMDQQITAVIVNRKENKLKKGVGYHLDLMILSVQIAVCTVLGLPWFVASTVIAVSHVMSLRQESEASAPGEKPQFLGVRENRLTNIIVGILTGVSAYLTVILRLIPMPVLYGVFLYMGVASLSGLQFIDRFLLLFMPQKYQPDYVYLRHVKTWRVHMFTLIQLVFFIALWVVKTISIISIAFPVMLLVLCLIRKLMECGLFTLRELRELDDPLPEQHKKDKENMKKQLQQVASSIDLPGGVLEIPLKDGRHMTIPSADIVFKPNKKKPFKRGSTGPSQQTEFVVQLGVDNPTFKTDDDANATTQL